MSKTCLMMVAGERSGDLYGAELAAALRARLGDIELFGCGGEAMRRAGVDTTIDAHSITMLGITEVLGGLPRVYRAFKTLLAEVDRRRPQLAVLIDFPDFNLRLAKKLRERNVRIVYYVSPQVWAWRRGRLQQLKERIDQMLCLFDFEVEIYQKAGIPVEHVGHPLVDMVRPHLTREEFFTRTALDPQVTTVALLPGSRQKEVLYNLPPMLDAATRLSIARPIQFVVAIAPTLDPAWLESLVAQCYVGRAKVCTVAHATYDALQHGDVAVVASGTATVEATLRERPFVVVYRVSPLTWLMGKFLVDVPYYSMVNLLAGKALVTELIQNDFTAQKVASQVEYLLDHAEARARLVEGLRGVKARLGPSGATQRAADTVVRMLQASRPIPRAG
jgi:lipid-A-disaccharide synthase